MEQCKAGTDRNHRVHVVDQKRYGQWIFCRTTGGSSSTSNLPNEFQFDSLDDLVIEPAVSSKGEVQIFDDDEAICLFRLRDKQLAKKRNGENEKDLYRGFCVYLFSEKQKDAFQAWASGKADSLEDAI